MGFFLVRQACISAIGCKSRIRFTVGSISQESRRCGIHCEMDPIAIGFEGSRRQTFEPTNPARAGHIRQGSVGV